MWISYLNRNLGEVVVRSRAKDFHLQEFITSSSSDASKTAAGMELQNHSTFTLKYCCGENQMRFPDHKWFYSSNFMSETHESVNLSNYLSEHKLMANFERRTALV